jgi:adenosine deaminase
MKIDSVLRHLLTDDASLSAYIGGYQVNFADVKRRMFLKERNENNKIPDHHYRLIQEKTFLNINTIGDILRKGLYNLAAERLKISGNKIFVRQQRQNDWQELITRIPPLILQAAYIHIENPLTDLSPEGLSLYFNSHILPNFRNTALPHPFIPQLEQYITKHQGLHDLHMHLNGATETDSTWQSFLHYPDKCYEELEKAFTVPKVREQLEQESNLLSPLKFYNLLRIAGKIRITLFDFIFSSNREKYEGNTETEILQMIIFSEAEYDNVLNPFSDLISAERNFPYQMAVEALMNVLVFRYIGFNNEGLVPKLFHFYLLILGLCNRLLVQQTHQYGFEQFQKHTLNGLREYTEKVYIDRFLQLHGNEFRNISFLEGRFSPKKTAEENIALFNSINKGWKGLQIEIKKILNTEVSGNKFPPAPEPQLKLVAHFIKREDSTPPDPDIRHRNLRNDTWDRALVLALIKKSYPSYSRNITGIDAAASEFDAPPEVFAPTFRMLRREGWKNFTYHAGEDFHHIISGIRSIYEAVMFTEMEEGNRIGHATATGLSAEQWVKAIGGHILIRKGEWLDNLIFVYHLIVTAEIVKLNHHIPLLINEIQGLVHEIYRKYYPIKVMEDSWLLRKYCPIMVLSKDLEEAANHNVYNSFEFAEIQKQKIAVESLEVLRCYHSSFFKNSYDEIININATSIFGAGDIEILQLEILKFLHKREIVIETLPTSNVRIGHHYDYNTYHLWNWIKWEEEGHYIPPIVVGTDDTGIFATNIYNEYANLYCHLVEKGEMTHTKALSVIEKLDKNGQIYRFDSKIS